MYAPDSSSQGGTRDEMCMRCGAWIPARGTYCPRCGALKPSVADLGDQQAASQLHYGTGFGYGRYQPYTKKPIQWRTLARTLSAAIMISFGLYLVVCLFTLIYGVGIVAPEISDHSYTFHFVLLIFIPMATVSGSGLLAYYLLLVATILVSAVWLALKSGPMFARELTMKGTARKHSPFFDLCGLMFAIFFINTVIVLFLTISGSTLASPVEELEDWELLFILANASVWEELIARVMLIGLPLLFVDAIHKGALRPPRRYIIGGGIEIGWVQAALIIVSATLFGLAHYEGWGSWKVFPAGLAGVAFGYMFLKHGLPAAIMLHFSFDYLSMPLAVFDDLIMMQLIVALGILLWIGLGMAFAVYFTVRIAEFVTKKKYLDEEVPAPVGIAGPYPAIQQAIGYQSPIQKTWHPSAGVGRGFFVCPFCGSGEAKWHDGGLQCLRCGKTFQ